MEVSQDISYIFNEKFVDIYCSIVWHDREKKRNLKRKRVKMHG